MATTARNESVRLIPSLGDTQGDIWCGWKSAAADVSGGHLRHVYGFDVDQCLEFFFDAQGDLSVVVGCRLARKATPIEVSLVERSITNGRLEIYRRGPWNTYHDRRHDRAVLHRATGRPVRAA